MLSALRTMHRAGKEQGACWARLGPWRGTKLRAATDAFVLASLHHWLSPARKQPIPPLHELIPPLNSIT